MKAFQGFRHHHLDRHILVKSQEVHVPFAVSGTFSKFQWFGAKSEIFWN